MYKLERGVAVNIATEIDAMARHTVTRWDNVPDLKALFELAYQSAAHDGRFWFDHYAVSELLHEKAEERLALLKICCGQEEGGFLRSYDHCTLMYRQMSSEASSSFLEAARSIHGKWDFSQRADKVYQEALTHFKGLADARPKGWDALAEGYSDFDGMSEYDPADARAFEGADTVSAGADGFSGRIALPYVMYDERCQGRKAARVLLSSAYAHFLRILEHANGEAMMEEIGKLDFREQELKPIFDLKLEPRHPILATLVQLVTKGPDGELLPTETEYLDWVESRRAFARKSPEEQAAISKAREAEMAVFMANLGKELKSDDYTIRREKKDAFIIQALLANERRLSGPVAQ